MPRSPRPWDRVGRDACRFGLLGDRLTHEVEITVRTQILLLVENRHPCKHVLVVGAAIDLNEPEASRLDTFMLAQGSAAQNWTMAPNEGAVITDDGHPWPGQCSLWASQGLGPRSSHF